jgi:ABC-type multidrug transport system ATPase subunit
MQRGSVSIAGNDLRTEPEKVRESIGIVFQELTLDRDMTVKEILEYHGRLYSMPKAIRKARIDELLDLVELEGKRDTLTKNLSGGMKRRLGIAQALIGEPRIIIVDEPTTGLDPEERIRFRNILSELSQKDVIIILSTHIVGDISSVCHDLALLNNGMVHFKGSPEELIAKAHGHVWQKITSGTEYDIIKSNYAVTSTIPTEDGWEIQFVGDNLSIDHATEIDPNLEHAYVYFIESEI